ncbi:monoamine oxidase [Flavobacterium sp. CG_23.5]|uniref:flavin monoamine oxidase family protein n=1 Tax=Flavobacterium sp. CG_23.5 TaxID=2760708 RepID=UPI001AE13F8B|nr:FAD-dependent oxidoreductase [Flavobacterium sp. CG_23.5]MBP2283905.1 monoamine oxidase [Flavobacterium sp. CG_23.5]
MSKPNIVIIGAGLTGLATAYFLQKKGIEFVVLEANDSIGGRIETIIGSHGATMEMGATWFGRQHPHLIQLLDELKLEYFKQYTQGISLFETMSFVPPQKFEIPDSEEPSYRIVGGTKILIEKLVSQVGLQNIKTQTKVISIKEIGNQLELTDSIGNCFLASKVISTLPPNLLVQTIQFEPNLPESFIQLGKETHTWMGESIKFAVEYANPFWRENGFSGTLFSQVGIINEMYDHSTYDTTGFALKGFLNGGTNILSKEDRKAKVIAQLIKGFGPAAADYVGYHEKVWRDDPLVFYPYETLVMGHQNNGHALYKNALLNEKLYISGSETASENPGYMDGAIVAAKTIVSKFQ